MLDTDKSIFKATAFLRNEYPILRDLITNYL